MVPVRAVWAAGEVAPQNNLFLVETAEGVSTYVRPTKSQAGFYVAAEFCAGTTIAQMLSNPHIDCYHRALRMRDEITARPEYAFDGQFQKPIVSADIGTRPHADLCAPRDGKPAPCAQRHADLANVQAKTARHADLGDLPVVKQHPIASTAKKP